MGLRDRDGVGLCGKCGHARVVESARGSRFYLCRLSETDPRFVRYPALPVLRCEGYRQATDGPEGGRRAKHPGNG